MHQNNLNEHIEGLVEELESLPTHEARLAHAQTWFAAITHQFTLSLSDDELSDLDETLRTWFTITELLSIYRSDINSPEKMMLFIDEAAEEDDDYVALLQWYFRDADLPQKFSLEIKYRKISSLNASGKFSVYLQHETGQLQRQLMAWYLQDCVTHCKLTELKRLLDYSPELMAAVLRTLDPSVSVNCLNLLELKASACANDYLATIAIGDITTETGQLICAAIAEAKTYAFNPVIVEEDQWGEFIDTLNQHHALLVGKTTYFIATGPHWISGCIRGKQEGFDVCIVDSLGCLAWSELHLDTKFMLEETLAGLASPRVFILRDKRQHSMFGCSVYALDDVRHLHTLERYLPVAYNSSGMFGYFANHSVPVEVPGTGWCYVAAMPLTLLRSMQSTSLFAKIETYGDENALPINKYGETAAQSAQKYFRVIDGKPVNRRYHHKLAVFKNHVLNLLKNEDDTSVRQKMQKFELATWQASLAEQSATQAVRP